MKPVAARFPLAFAAVLIASGLAHGQAADRPIVFSARYYSAPSGRAPSRHHLYRINPDGTGRQQLTSGTGADEIRPVWSPDGSSIAFLSLPPGDDESVGKGTVRLNVMRVSGGAAVKTLLRTTSTGAALTYSFAPTGNLLAVAVPYGEDADIRQLPCIIDTATGAMVAPLPGVTELRWSQDGKLLYLQTGEETGAIFDLATKKRTPIAEKVRSAAWAGSDLIARPAEGDGSTLLVIAPATGAVTRRITLQPAADVKKALASDEADLSYFFDVAPVLRDPKSVFLSRVAGDSTSGKWLARCRVSLSDGTMTEWGESGTIAASPDGRRFATAMGRTLASYGRPRKGSKEPRNVWVRPLFVADFARPGSTKTLVSGLVFVSGYDWRNGTRTL